jgi:hypothetical protein
MQAANRQVEGMAEALLKVRVPLPISTFSMHDSELHHHPAGCISEHMFSSAHPPVARFFK